MRVGYVPLAVMIRVAALLKTRQVPVVEHIQDVVDAYMAILMSQCLKQGS